MAHCDRCGDFVGSDFILVDSLELCLDCGVKVEVGPRGHRNVIIARRAVILFGMLSLGMVFVFGFAGGLLWDVSGDLALLGPAWSLTRVLICLLPSSFLSFVVSCGYAALARAFDNRASGH